MSTKQKDEWQSNEKLRKERRRQSQCKRRKNQRDQEIRIRRQEDNTNSQKKNRELKAAKEWAKKERERWHIEKMDYMAQLAVVIEKNRSTQMPATSNDEANENMEQEEISMEQEEQQTVDVNAVAKEYSEAYENGTQFVSCASCDLEDSKIKMTPVDTVCRTQYDFTGLKKLYRKQVLDVQQTNVYDVRFTEAVEAEFTEEGLLKTCCFICNICLKAIKRNRTEMATYEVNNKKDEQETENYGNVEVKKKIPRWALLNGLFQGAVPDELTRLNQYERNLIALICPITMVRLHNKSFHKSISRTYTVVNEIRFASTVLPRYDAGNQYVLLKHVPDSLMNNSRTD